MGGTSRNGITIARMDLRTYSELNPEAFSHNQSNRSVRE